MTESNSKRLFVPLASKPFEWFRTGQKRWELRRYGRQYTERHVLPGRMVELRRGYQVRGGTLWGTVGRTIRAQSLAEFFDQVRFSLVVPEAHDQEEAVQFVASILGIREGEQAEVFGFEVRLID